MISLDETQQAIADATVKQEISWLFEVDKNGNSVVDYYWSTKAKTWSAQPYTFKIIDFPGVEMNRAQSESGIQVPSEFEFTISNKDNALSPSDFSGGNVTLRLVIKAGVNEAEIRSWNFDIEGVEPGPHKLFFQCRDWLQKYLQGDYPNTSFINHLFPQEDTETANFCVPLIFGKPCIPIAPVVFNLVTNAYMEETGNWANWGSTSPTVNARSTAYVKEGDYSRRFTVQGTSARSGIKSDVFTTENGKTYTIDFWFYPVNCSLVDIAVRKGDNSGWLVYDKHFFGTVLKWCHARFSFTEGAATGGAGAYIVFYGWAEPETARTRYIDALFLGRSRYLLGEKITNPTDYDVDEIQTPRDWDGDHEVWSKNDYTFSYFHDTGSDSNDYTFAEFIIEDCNGDGTPDANIVFKKGKRYLPPGAWYTRSDTITKTSPADILDYILKDWGIPSARIDATTLAAVKATYTTWGLTWNLGLWSKEPRKKLLARLLLMCHTELIVRDKIYFKVHVKASQKTLTKAHILKTRDRAATTFKYDLNISSDIKDSGYITFQEKAKCLDSLIKVLVTVKGSADNISTDVISANYIQDSQNAQRVGILALQRKYLALAKTIYGTKGTCLALECDDVITINHADYGGSYAVLIDRITINKGGSLDIEATRFSEVLDDWDDLLPPAIEIIQSPDSDGYKVVISGPDAVNAAGSNIGNVLPGRLRVGATGNYILLDPVEPIIKFVEGGVTRFKLGDLGTDDWGLEILDHSGNSIMKLDGSGTNTIAGWTLSTTKLAKGTDIILDSDAKAISINSPTFGTEGIQLQHNAGTPRAYIGDGANQYLKFDGTNSEIKLGTILIDGANTRIRSTNYVSGMAGAGFTLEPDLLEVGNIAARGIIRTAVFQKDIISAIGGNLAVLRADVLVTDMTVAGTSLTIEGNETFAVGDFLRSKDGTDDEWMEVTADGSAPTYTVIRNKASAPGGAPAWKKGATVVNYGQSGQGFIYLTASETNAPHMSVATHAGSPWSALSTKVRLGNLNGYAGYSSDIYGLALYEDANNFLKFDPTNGIRISISATDALQIQGGGNIKVLAGGDIYLVGNDTDPGRLYFDGTSYGVSMGCNAVGSIFQIGPSSDNVVSYRIGYSDIYPDLFQNIHIRGKSMVRSYAYWDDTQNSRIDIYSNDPSVKFILEYDSVIADIIMSYGISGFQFYPDDNFVDFGLIGKRWKTGFFVDLTVTNCITEGTCEIIPGDALAIIEDIVEPGSGIFNEFGHERFDMRRLQSKYPYLFVYNEEADEYLEKVGTKSDLLYKATMQLNERLTKIETLIGSN